MRPFTFIASLHACSLLALGLAASASAQNLINGEMDDWASVNGTPPRGVPLFWAGTVTQTRGLVAGSSYSATVLSPDNLVQIPTITNQPVFALSFQFVATDSGGGGGNRSLQLVLKQPGGSQPINLLVARGTVPEKLSLRAHNGTDFVPVATDAFEASLYDPVSGSWSDAKVYQISIQGYMGKGPQASAYTLSYGPVDGPQTTLPDLHFFFQAPVPTGLDQVRFTAGGLSSPFAVDSISLVTSAEKNAAQK